MEDTIMNKNIEIIEILVGLVKADFEIEYKDYLEGYKGAIEQLTCWGSGILRREMYNRILRIIDNNRPLADQLNEYFDSDFGLASLLLSQIKDEIIPKEDRDNEYIRGLNEIYSS